ncbi:phage/plasmid primase, P4 family [uncultured Phascolarctobacterium sp.]|uniref:phage/plasmid primase, P4 family n=1 Tax=uncultured Phascolarctobacterium sp. TaxID=512296 RepID=UPI0015ADF7AB|nr:phage/plasmid primase, P4 family [uncultured Phascolarctobacterium sp.]
MKYDNLPKYIKDNASFCLWKYEERKNGEKPTKVPYQVSGKKAMPNNEKTFTTFETALSVVNKFDGLGLGVFGGISAIDIDNCINEDGSLTDMAIAIIALFDGCYIEKSPSGRGFRILFITTNFKYDKDRYYINNQKIGLEVYVCGATNKFVTLTGDVVKNGGIINVTDKLQILLDTYMLRSELPNQNNTNQNTCSYLSDDEVLLKAKASANAAKFMALWNGEIPTGKSHSEADMSLATILAFWCGRDIEQMDRLFRNSSLMRDKWDRAQSGSTYGRLTLEKAIMGVSDTFTPIVRLSPQEDFAEQQTQDLRAIKPFSNSKYPCTDIGNSNLFADYFKSIARYVPERKQWFVYDGKAWQGDIGNLKVMNQCKKLANKLMHYALSIKEEDTRKLYIDYAKKWQTRRTREIILRDAQDIHPLPMSEFDKDIYLLNCQNGTLNLQDGSFYPHNPSDYITKIAGVRYDPNAKCKRWEQFIDEVMSGDKEKAEFLQKSLGYALTGDTRYETMFILFGATTRNGKGTSMETFLRICGDYGKTCRPETIGMKVNNSSSSPSEDVARLAGARFVNISEPDRKLTLSAALLKTLTGNDTINARFLHENSFDFKPQFKIFTNTNHLPIVTDLTLLTSGRVKIIPFERHFEEWEQDKGLKAEFTKEENLSGILNWVLDGYRKLKQTGFNVPSSVTEATLSYQRENDKVAQFIEEKLEENGNSEERTSEVYLAYQGWCRENGYYPENARNFKSALSNIGTIIRKRPRTGGDKTTMLIGYQLLRGQDFLS